MGEPTAAAVEWLTIIGEPETWRSLGLRVSTDGVIPLIGPSLRIVPRASVPDAGPHDIGRRGIVGWALSGVDRGVTSIDGLDTDVVDAGTPLYAAHEVGASGLDHVVVMTPDLERTAVAVTAATGCELKRVREVGPMRQGFHRIGRGGLIVELVSRPEVPDGPAAFWGVVIDVDDLDAACAVIGPDRISDPKDAVQPGRRIATVREDVGLGVPLAIMTT